MNRWLICGIATFVTIGLVLFIALMSVSFQTLEYDQWGIKYNTVSRYLYDSVEDQGRHYVAPGETYFVFQNTYITLNFLNSSESNTNDDVTNIDCITNDGLTVLMDVTVQYQLIEAKLYDFLLDWGTDYEYFVVAQIRSAVRDACSNKTAEQMYDDRQDVQTTMLDAVQTLLADVVDVIYLELINIQLPTNYSNAVAAKVTASNDVQQATNERAQALILSETGVLTAIEDAKIALIKAQANYDGIIVAAQNEADAITLDLNTQATVYAAVKEALGLSADDLINFISIDQLVAIPDLVVGIQAPATFGIYNPTGSGNSTTPGTSGASSSTQSNSVSGTTPGSTS